MATPAAAPIKASDVIPGLFRFLLLNVEPLFAFNGAVLCLIQPSRYTSALTRGAISSSTSLLSSAASSISSSSAVSLSPVGPAFIYTQLAGGWLHFAFTEAIVLRLVDHVSVWRLICMGMLLSDLAYVHSCARAVGGWGEWLVLSHWTLEDWVVTVTTWPFFLARIAVVLGIGQREAPSAADVKKTS